MVYFFDDMDAPEMEDGEEAGDEEEEMEEGDAE